MTVTEQPTPSVPPYPGAPHRFALGGYDAGQSRREMSLRELAHRVARRRWLLGSIFTVVLGSIAVWAFTATPRYKSEARLRIESRTPVPSLADQVASIPGASMLGLARDDLETEIAILRSDRITDAAIDSLALGVRVLRPAASRARVLSARVIDPNVGLDGRLILTREQNRYRVERQKLETITDLPQFLVPGQPVMLGGTEITLAPTLTASGPAEIVVEFLPRFRVHQLFDRRLVVARQGGGSRLVEVSYQDTDRELAAEVVARLVAEFVAYTTRTEQGDDTTAVARLQAETAEAKRKLAEAEAALRTFEEQNRLVAPEEQAAAQIKRLAAISTQGDAISVERNALARVLAIVDERSRGGDHPSAYRQLATFPSLITNRAIQDLLQALLDLENERSLLSVRRTENNEEYRQLTTRITELERQLHELGPQYLESLDQQLATTANVVTALTDTLRAMPAAATRYGQLVRDRTVQETIYAALEKQLKQAELKDVLRLQRVRVIDAPRVANEKDRVFPKKAVMLVLGAVLGMTLALVTGLFLELWNDRPEVTA